MAVRDDFAAGEVLAAADLNDTFASKVDYALPTNAQTGTTYTFVAADAEKLTTASNAAAVTLTIPPQSSVTWADNTVLRVVNYGAGAVTIDGGSGVTVTNTSSTVAQYGAAVAIRTGSDAWTVVPFGGGDIPAATVSSPAATGQYTDTGITYDYYTFTSSGTLTVDTAGFADVLVVGGGGGGGSGRGGGGGAGGHNEIAAVYLHTGNYTVTIGGGGTGGVQVGNEGRNGNNGIASRIGRFFSTGGGGGAGPTRNSAGQTYSGAGLNGASGGGSSAFGIGSAAAAGSGFNPIGSAGGVAVTGAAGGGGGGSAGGGAGVSTTGGGGGAGSSNSYTGTSVTRSGGGGGSSVTGGAGGSGGGGAGGTTTTNGTAGTANTGGGGGGGGDANNGGNGGSGIVIVRVAV